MNRSKINKINFFMWIALFAIFFFTTIQINSKLKQEVPDILEYKKINSEGIDFKKLQDVKQNYKNLNITGYCEVNCTVKNSLDVVCSDIKNKVVLTDENYFSIYPYKLIKGDRINSDTIKNFERVAVISEKLAIGLYKSTDVIGNIININNENYRIIGVYRMNESLIHSISDDEYDRVIVPYNCYGFDNKKEKLSLNVFSLSQSSKNTPEKIQKQLQDSLQDKLLLYNKVDYSKAKKINLQYFKILIFIIGFFIIVKIMKIMINRFKKFIRTFKVKLKSNYFIEVLKINKFHVLRFIVEISMYIIICFVIFNIIKFNIIVEDKYLPPENVFDISFYKEAIIKNAQLINANEVGFSNIYNRYLDKVGSLEVPLLTIQGAVSK